MNAFFLLFAVCIVLSLASAVCNLTVIVQMCMHDAVVLALIGFFICGFIPFFYGWAKANEWDNVPLMIAWSVCNVCLIVTWAILFPVLQSIPA